MHYLLSENEAYVDGRTRTATLHLPGASTSFFLMLAIGLVGAYFLLSSLASSATSRASFSVALAESGRPRRRPENLLSTACKRYN